MWDFTQDFSISFRQSKCKLCWLSQNIIIAELYLSLRKRAISRFLGQKITRYISSIFFANISTRIGSWFVAGLSFIGRGVYGRNKFHFSLFPWFIQYSIHRDKTNQPVWFLSHIALPHKDSRDVWANSIGKEIIQFLYDDGI